MIFSRFGTRFYFYIIYLILLSHVSLGANSDLITVEKKNVLHKFVRVDNATDHFTQNVFPSWENETFDVFDQVKDPNGIAVDLGAWIGTTSIWLSKNFHHVVAVEADKESIKCLKLNLEASDCTNVTICEKPIAQLSQDVIFGPRGPVLNESISFAKDYSDNPLDYVVRSVTFKELIYNSVYDNKTLNNLNISFIKCDIEGGEENILEDLLHFAYYNDCPVYISFHLDWWTSKNIADFQYLFEYFEIKNSNIKNIPLYLHFNPFASLLLYPKKNGDLIKKNMTAVIIGYNQYSYIKNMVSQLEKYTKDIVIIDNNSTYEPLLDYYQNEYKYSLLRQRENFGHRVYKESWVRNLVGDVFILTDPDLKFNENLPDNFIDQLISISNYFKAGRVGFALLIDSDDIRTDISFAGYSIKEWEIRFWKHKIYGYVTNPYLELYSAPLDTTFGLVTRKYGGEDIDGSHIRVGGDFTCKHIPWHTDFKDYLAPGEYEAYLIGNRSTNWFKTDK